MKILESEIPTQIFDRCCHSSAVGSLKTIFAQRLLGEKGAIKLNNDANNGNVNYCLLRHIRSAVIPW